MSERFQVGEVVEFTNQVRGPQEWIGREVTVIGSHIVPDPLLRIFRHADGTTETGSGLMYVIEAPYLPRPRAIWLACPYELRRRRLPPNWEEIATSESKRVIEKPKVEEVMP